MAFCIGCGNSMEEGVKFCSNCGRPTSGEASILKRDGKAQSMLNEFLHEIAYIFRNIILKPITTISEVKDRLSRGSTFILTAILIFINGILGIWGMKVVSTIVISNLKSIFKDYFIGLGNANYANISFRIGFDQLFFYSAILYLVFIITLFGGIFIFYRYYLKGSEGGATLWKVAIVTTIPLVVAEFVALFISYIFPLVSLGIIIFGLIFSSLILYKGVNSIVEEKENKIIYIIPLIYLFVLIITFLVLSYMMKTINISFINSNFLRVT